MADSLQDQLDRLKPGETFKLDPPQREFKGPLVIRQPVVLDGQNGTIWTEKGPVVRIEAAGVTLRDVNVEITSRDAALSGDAACALVVAPGLHVSLDNVSVRGNVTGLDREEGVWRCPLKLQLGDLKAGQPHTFRVLLVVPAPCHAESKIDGLHVEPRDVQGDPTSVIVRLDPMQPGTLLRGQIWLKTTFLTRRIMVSGRITDAASAQVGQGRTLWRPDGMPDPAPADPALNLALEQIPGSLQASPGATQPAPGQTTTMAPTGYAPGQTTPAAPTTVPATPVSAPIAMIVSQDDTGQFRTLGEALRAARTGARILVRPGTYKESLVLDRKVELVGDGPSSEIIIESTDSNCLRLTADMARVRGLTLRGSAGRTSRERYAVFAAQGQLVLDDCSITSDSLACVAAGGSGSAAVLRRCVIKGGRSAGVLVYDRAEASLEDCEIAENGLAGVESRQGAHPTLRRCKVRDGKHVGVLVHAQGKATLEDCEIWGHALANVEIRQGGDPHLRRCKVRSGRGAGVLVHDGGLGTLEDCEILDNALGGLEVRRAGNPTLRNCRLAEGKQAGALFIHDAQGTLEDCKIHGNALAGVEIRRNSNPTLRRCLIYEGAETGVSVIDKGKGVLEDCEIYDTPLAAVEVRQGSNPTLRRCKIHDSQAAGVVTATRSTGVLEECDIYSNKGPGVAVGGESNPTLKKCKIRDNALAGMVVWQDGKGALEVCEVAGNGSAGVAILENAAPTVRRCRINRNADAGVWADKGGSGAVEECDLTGNKEGSLDAGGGELRLAKLKLDPE
jgi:F-box protein 11